MPNINFKRRISKLMLSIIEDDQNKEFQKSSKKTLGWVLFRDNTAAHLSEWKVPVWSSFNQILESEQNFLQANAGYPHLITVPPTRMKVNYEVLNRTLSINKK